MHSIYGLLPPNLQNEDARALAAGLDVGALDVSGRMKQFWPSLLAERAPEAWIPWLFYGLAGEDYMHPSFDLAWRRRILARLFDLYKLKGTVEGMRLHVDLLTDAKFLKMNHAPATSFLGVTLTSEDRELFDSKQPRIRAYPFRHRGKLAGMALSLCSLGVGAPVVGDTLLRAGTYVELYDPVLDTNMPLNSFLVETEDVERSAGRIVEIRKKSVAKGIFPGFSRNGLFFIDQNAGDRLYRLKLDLPFIDEVERRRPLSVVPSLIPVRLGYEYERVRSAVGSATLPGNRWTDEYPDRWKPFLGQRTFLCDTRADLRIRKLVRLFDPTRVVYPDRKPRVFLGVFRLGPLAAHRAELFVDARRPKLKAVGFLSVMNGKRFLVTGDSRERINRIVWAAGKDRRVAEKIACSTFNSRYVRTNESLMCGARQAGEFVQETI